MSKRDPEDLQDDNHLGSLDPTCIEEPASSTEKRTRPGHAGADRSEKNHRSVVQPVVDDDQLVGDRYLLGPPLGEGGMGYVLEARCTKLGKTFAIKRMHEDLQTNERLREFFYREARLASSLSHPNVVSVVDYGEDPQYGAYMVMELVEGEPLSQRIQKGSVPLRTTCEIILQIADALHYMHGRGIVHGDIKPENILLSRDRHSDKRRWKVTLLDFGLARMGQAIDREGVGVTGTPPYLAPERIRGEAPHPSQDLYSLGILGYQLITGHLPFDGRIEQITSGHLERLPPPFSDKTDEPTDSGFEKLIRKALEKAPEDRQADIAAFIYELRNLIEMQNLGKPRTRFKKSITLVPSVGASSKDLAALGFELCPFPAAVIDAHGTIGAANKSFARFIRKVDDPTLIGSSVFTKRVLGFDPELPTSLQAVLKTRTPLTRRIAIAKNSESHSVYISLTPDSGERPHVLMVVQRDSKNS